MSDNIIQEKAMGFAVRIVKMYQFLTDTKREYVLSKQLLRSGTSIGANIAEAIDAVSRKDFINKMSISLKECSETLFWIELLYRTEYINQKLYDSILEDCEELKRILTSIVKTTKGIR